MNLKKILSALLIAALLSSPAAVMEEALENVDEVSVELAEPVDETQEELVVDIDGDDILGEEEVDFYSPNAYGAAPSDSLFAAEGEVSIDEFNFPDQVFRDYIRSNYDSDGNGSLSASEISNARDMSLVGSDDSNTWLDVTGIKRLTSLETLTLGGNIASLDISGMTSLRQLICSINDMTALDLTGLNNLEYLDCGYNKLTTLDVRGFSNLEYLNCSDNELTSLDLTGLSNLKEFHCSGNRLTALDVSGLSKLETLDCENNQLTSLDVSRCPKLTMLYCGINRLTSLNISGCTELYALLCHDNQLSTVDIHGIPKLITATTGKRSSMEGRVSEDSNVQYDCYIISNADADNEEYYEYVVGVDRGVTLLTGLKDCNALRSINAMYSTKAVAYVGACYRLNLGGETGRSYKSSSKRVATVSSMGIITPKTPGKAKITFKVGNRSRTVTLTVRDLTIPKYVSLNLSGTVPARVGDTITLTPEMNDGAVSALKWTTSNRRVATVNNGVVTFRKKGTVTITVTTVKGRRKAKVKFKVSK